MRTKWYQKAGTSSTPVWMTTSAKNADEVSGLVLSMNAPMFQSAIADAK
jgi:hypothetical protein